MKFLIIGSRSIKSFDISAFVPKNVDLIISGGASGIDKIAEQYADKNKISKLIIRPQYARYRRGAPIKRNKKMIDICDEILAFWDGISSGTKSSILYAEETNTPIKVIRVDGNKNDIQ